MGFFLFLFVNYLLFTNSTIEYFCHFHFFQTFFSLVIVVGFNSRDKHISQLCVNVCVRSVCMKIKIKRKLYCVYVIKEKQENDNEENINKKMKTKNVANMSVGAEGEILHVRSTVLQ